MKNTIPFLSIALLVLPFLSCNTCRSDYTYNPPKNVHDGLNVGVLADVAIDTSLIIDAVKKIDCGKFNEIHSLLIFKDDRLILEEYFDGNRYQWDGRKYHGDLVEWDLNERQRIMSCTKSFVSAMVDIAIQKGFIESVHQSIFDYLPEYQQYRTKEKANVSIEHLLNMTSGLEWDEWSARHGTTANDIDLLYTEYSANPLDCVLERSLTSTPGEVFTYNGGGYIVLGKIIENASNMSLEEYSDEFLFTPLGIDSTSWLQFDDGTYAADGSLHMTPRDMLKFGILYLQNGDWKGRQLITNDWVDRSRVVYNNNLDIRLDSKGAGEIGYSFSWWVKEIVLNGKGIDLFGAGGWGGQEIIVLPDNNAVVVFTGSSYDSKTKTYKVLEQYIVPAFSL